MMLIKRSKGFSLVEIAISLAIISILIVSSYDLSSITSKYNKNVITQQNEYYVRQALIKYYATYGRLPCPALIDTAPSSQYYNSEYIVFTSVANPSPLLYPNTGTTPPTPPTTNQPYLTACGNSIASTATAAAHVGYGASSYPVDYFSRLNNNGTKSAPASPPTQSSTATMLNTYLGRISGPPEDYVDFRGVAYGAIPTATLMIDSKYMFDGFGNKLQYAVAARFVPNIATSLVAIQQVNIPVINNAPTYIYRKIDTSINFNAQAIPPRVGLYYGLAAGASVLQVNYSNSLLYVPPLWNDFISLNDFNTNNQVTNMGAFVLISLGADGIGTFNNQGSTSVAKSDPQTLSASVTGIITSSAGPSLPSGKNTATLNNIFYPTTTIVTGASNTIAPKAYDSLYSNGLFYTNGPGTSNQKFDDVVTYATINDIADAMPNLVRCQDIWAMDTLGQIMDGGNSWCNSTTHICWIPYGTNAPMGSQNIGSFPGQTVPLKSTANGSLWYNLDATATVKNIICNPGGIWGPPY